MLAVSRSGYYKWRSQKADKRAQAHRECMRIRDVWEDSGKTYGSPRIYVVVRCRIPTATD